MKKLRHLGLVALAVGTIAAAFTHNIYYFSAGFFVFMVCTGIEMVTL